MLLPQFYVDSPTPSPRKFGLFSVAQPTNLNNGKWLGGVEYPSDNCAWDVLFAADPCNPAAKDYSEEPGFFEADAFYVYTLRACRAPGAINDAKDRAVKTFTGAEERGAETGLWASLVADTNAVNLGATALCPEAAVAVLEDWLGKNYGGTGVIHAPRDAATFLATNARVRRHGNVLETELGTRVSAGAGYFYSGPGAAAGVDEAWLYATGEVTVRRSPTEVRGPLMKMTPADNTQVVLVERAYVVDYDCAVAAVKVSLAC